MKKLAFVLIVLGSGLAAFGFSGWQAATQPNFVLAGVDAPNWLLSAGWSVDNRLLITIGVVMLVCGLLLRRESN